MLKRKNEKRVKKKRENSLLCSFAGIITSVLGFSGSFTRWWLKEMKMSLISGFVTQR